MKATNYSL